MVKIPRFAFEKFPGADPTLGTQMKSVGEVMAIGRTFKESLQKALRGLEIKRAGLGCDSRRARNHPAPDDGRLRELLSRPNERTHLRHPPGACCAASPSRRSIDLTDIDPWFLRNIEDLINEETIRW